jgi:RNA polymerase sigma-70 factor (ECF subfamily)
LSGIRDGDQDAFEKIYTSFHERVYFFARGFTKDEVAAEEITQEVFIKVWETRERLNPHLAFRSYLYSITKNHALNQIKRLSCENRFKQQWVAGFQYHSNSTENYVEYRDSQQIIHQGMAMLPPRRQAIFRMNRMEGIKYDQIAATMHVSRNTIKSQLGKASRFMKDYFNAYQKTVVYY